MTENIPPNSGTKPVSASDRPGLPYYEKLRRDLRDTLQKKRLLDRNLASVEDQIYHQESRYLEETSVAGNIVKGFDSYIKSSAAQGGGAGTISGSAVGGLGLGRRKAAVNDGDRVFSRSSVSYMRDSDSPSSATSTPGHAATPTGSFTTEKADKKKKKSTAGNDDDTDNKTDVRSNKRQKITFGGGGRKTMNED